LLLRPPQLLELRNKLETSKFSNSRMKSNSFTERESKNRKKLLLLKLPLRKPNASRKKRRLRLDVLRLSKKPREGD